MVRPRGPVLDHVQVADVEVLGQVAAHPDVVNPEELDFGGGSGQGGRSAGVGDEEPAGAGGGIDFTVSLTPGNFLRGNRPLASKGNSAGSHM